MPVGRSHTIEEKAPTMSNVRIWIVVAGAIMVLALGWHYFSGREAGNVIVVYTSVDDVFARPVAERFARETGIEVKLVPDTEETKSTGLLNRLIAEKNRPRADVFWSGDPVRAEILRVEGVAAPYRSRQAIGLPEAFSDPNGYWTGFSARARVLIFNRDRVAEGSEPRSILDLLEPRFEGQACLANPLFGTTSMHAAALFAVLGGEEARAFFEGFTANSGILVSSNGEVRRRVGSGDCAVGVTDSDDAAVAVAEGKPIGVVYPDATGMGTLIIPNAAVLIAKGPNPKGGKAFIDFLLSPETEQMLARSDAAQIPLRANVTVPDGVPSLSTLSPMTVEYSRLAGLLKELSRGYLKEWTSAHQ